MPACWLVSEECPLHILHAARPWGTSLQASLSAFLSGFGLCSGLVLQRRQWQPTPVLLPGKSHGWRSLVRCSPWGHGESHTTERLHFHFSLSSTGEGNGNPLQCSCLENPRDGGAWWAAVYGVSQSQTRLKWLSSSSKLAAQTRPRCFPCCCLVHAQPHTQRLR